MAYPWTANDILTAADLNAAIDSAIVTTGLTLDTYTPTLTQSATVTKTIEYCKYHTVAGMTTVTVSLSVTGSGTASNEIIIGLPVAPNAYRLLGRGAIYDASANTWYNGAAIYVSSTTFKIYSNAVTAAFGAATFTAGLASGDIVSYTLTYY